MKKIFIKACKLRKIFISTVGIEFTCKIYNKEN